MTVTKDSPNYEEWKRNLSLSKKGKVQSEESKLKKSLALKGRKRDTSHLQTPEVIAKSAATRKGRPAHPNSHSEAARAKHSASIKGRAAPNRIEFDDDLLIKQYADERVDVEEIAKAYQTTPQTVYRRLRELGIVRTNSEAHIGQKAHNYKGRVRTVHGYVMLRIPKDDPLYSMVNRTGTVAEHRYVMAQHIGRCLERWEVVHHKNHDRSDNRLENLELMQSQTQHHAETLAHIEMLRLKSENEMLKAENQELKGRIAALKSQGCSVVTEGQGENNE